MNVFLYRLRSPSAYLMISWKTLRKSLQELLDHPLNRRNEQRFIHSRLQLLDRHFSLDHDRRLWQAYLDIGSNENFWPVNDTQDRSFS